MSGLPKAMILKMKHALKAYVAKTFNLYMKPIVHTRYMADHSVVTRLLRYILPDNPVYVEIGAGIQGSAPTFHRELGVRKENCYLIEACPNNFPLLVKNTSGGYRHFHLAITDKNAEVPFYIYMDKTRPDYPSSKLNTVDRDYAIARFGGEKNFHEVIVRGVTFDSFLDEQGIKTVDLLMVNCEGAEYNIFDRDGAFWSKLGFVMITLHVGWGTADTLRETRYRIFDRFLSNGFELIGGHERADIEDSDHNLEYFFQRKGYGRAP